MTGFTLHELQCFDAVVRAGGFQAAASALHRSHPAVFAAVAKLERQLGVALLDRSGYRVRPTAAGASLQQRAQALLQEAEALQRHARHLADGEEPQLRIVIGDLCPRPQVLALLGGFFAQCPGTRLHLHDEAIGGPAERLFDDEADLILHRVDAGDARLDTVALGRVALLPVAAPGFLPDARAPTPARLRDRMQCILRDTARHAADRSWYVVEGAPQCTVADQRTKKDVILQGLAWGHLPRFLIEDELRDGRLRSLAGRHFPGIVEDLVAARRRDRPHGPVAERLWRHIEAQAPALRAALGARRS
ncbi:LysR family transcriptional regulator [Luteimonas sp. Y-2-2-4F]|nr:LysR family transcriptional regulator [Luteimonas sp. Y-2-2-4F]MCD9032986.1 LysR family transcriptional regulator [Luteimonas sp. Y-2-2-4F]